MTDRPERANEIDQAGDRTPASLPARYGRRALMLGAAATGAGVAASLVGGGMAEAAPDLSPPVLLGKTSTASGTTRVVSRGGSGLAGRAATKGQSGVTGYDTFAGGSGLSSGVTGHSENGYGVNGISVRHTGVVGTSFRVGQSGTAGIDFCTTKGAQGIYGQSNNGNGVFGISFKGNGVVGESNTPGHSGIVGLDRAPHSGNAVFAQSHDGTAVLATSENGTALHVEGKAKFKNSGVATVPGGQKTVTVKVAGLTASGLVLATIQRPQAGVFIEAAQPGAGSFKITLSKNASSALPIAWFVIG